MAERKQPPPSALLPEGLPLQRGVGLAGLTTLGIGGDARFFATPSTPDEVLACFAWARREGLSTWVLGGGSNVVIADAGLDGLVLQLQAEHREIEREDADGVLVRVGAGHEWDALVSWSVAQDLAGIACLSGIPGKVGAAPIQNIGAYGQELCEVFVDAQVLDTTTQHVERWDAQRCAFGYRQSALKRGPRGRWVVLELCLRLQRAGRPTLRYPELRRQLGMDSDAPLPTSVTLQDVRDAVLTLRRRKSMVVDPDDPNSASAGSFFVNPIIPETQAGQVRARFDAQGVDASNMPCYPAEEGKVKLSAAWLIDHSGLHKGYGDGRVGLSQHHTLALVNRGGASAQELLTFARFVQQHVADFCGITLHPEPVFLGFPDNPLQS